MIKKMGPRQSVGAHSLALLTCYTSVGQGSDPRDCGGDYFRFLQIAAWVSDRPDTGWSASKNQITWLQHAPFRQETDQLSDRKDEVFCIA